MVYAWSTSNNYHTDNLWNHLLQLLSMQAVNLKACNSFRMYNGKAAENELKQLAELSNGTYLENDLIRHNLVVFRGGENALQVSIDIQEDSGHVACPRQLGFGALWQRSSPHPERVYYTHIEPST